ncbi:MAG: hypothetical protein V2A75_06775 [Pseudomonadota bacterium]
MSSENLPDVNQNGVDDTASFLKIAAGFVPLAGPIFAEIIGSLIPNQRMDRITEFLKILDIRVQALGHDWETLREKMTEESFMNLFEEGTWQAARASSTEQKEYIANLLANGIDDEVLDELQKGVFLKILSELNDAEILILYSYTHKMWNDADFYEQHKDILIGPIAHTGSDSDDINDETVYKTYREKLIRLNLLNLTFPSVKKGEIPDFDPKTGIMKSRGHELTSLGRLFLKYIGLEDIF